VTERWPAARPRRHRMHPWASDHRGLATCIAVVVGVALVVVAVKISQKIAPASSPPPHAYSQLAYLGVYEPGVPASYSAVEQFAHDVGREPNLVPYYSGWGEEFQTAFADTAARHRATVIVQMDPTNISLARIADGAYDSYLTSFARQVAVFRHSVVISFGHEMNGFWETWGYRHAPPADFVAAWRHIVSLFRRQGAGNVIWLWQVNSASSLTGPVRDWWPGARYVTWVGVSGYYYIPGNTFENVFGPVVAAIRKFTQDPLLIAETAVGPQAGQVRGIKNLFAGLRTQHYLGLVWFDQHSHGGLYKGENWRLEGNLVALAAFRSALHG
jgi:mannan endo-1,4-beta-mannosidase